MTILLADGKVQSIKPQDLGLLRKGKGGSNLHLWTGCLSKADLKSAEHDPSLSCTTTMPRCTFVGVYYRVGLACSRALFISTVISSAAAIRPFCFPFIVPRTLPSHPSLSCTPWDIDNSLPILSPALPLTLCFAARRLTGRGTSQLRLINNEPQ